MTTITTDLQPRLQHPAMLLPDAMAALQAVGASVGQGDVSDQTIELVNMRASQINGCGVCLVGHVRGAKKHGETDDRLAAVAGWRDAPFFTPALRRGPAGRPGAGDRQHQRLEPAERGHPPGRGRLGGLRPKPRGPGTGSAVTLLSTRPSRSTRARSALDFRARSFGAAAVVMICFFIP